MGYTPAFTFLSQISGWLDLIPGLSKGTYTWTAHSQLTDILCCLEHALALASVSKITGLIYLSLLASNKMADRRGNRYPVVVFDGLLETLQSMHNREEARRILEVIFDFSISFHWLFFYYFGLTLLR